MKKALVLLTVTAALFLSLVSPALAHERREVGPYTFSAGFLDEPAFTEQLNGVYLKVTETATKEPVEGVEETLKVEVRAGGQSKTYDLRDVHGQPGVYTADLVPTLSGGYVLQFTGTIGDLKVDETFESGPGRFHEPEPLEELRFPQMPDAAEQAAQSAAEARTIALIALVLSPLLFGGLVIAGRMAARRGKRK